MLIEALLALTTMAPLVDAGARVVPARVAALLGTGARERVPPSAIPYFSVTARAVSNWREEAGGSLMPRSLALVAQYASTEPAFVARCVRLNNYWCIKQARWAGELGGDAENHTAFATAADGADAAALLVRRYYREFNRRNALAIVRRWAPAECGLPRPVATSRPLTLPSPRPTLAARAMATSQPRRGVPISADLAPHGLGKTLRARYLARRAPGGAPRRIASARPARPVGLSAQPSPPRIGTDMNLRVQPWSARARLAGHAGRAPSAARAVPAPKPVADIATGLGARPIEDARADTRPASRDLAPRPPIAARLAPMPMPRLVNPASVLAQDRLLAEAAALPSIAAGLPAGSLLDLRLPAPLCGNDETRIRNYASRIATSVGLRPDDDLRLFDGDGQPTENLRPVLLAMSSVELGALRASPALVTASIERLRLRFTGIAASSQ